MAAFPRNCITGDDVAVAQPVFVAFHLRLVSAQLCVQLSNSATAASASLVRPVLVLTVCLVDRWSLFGFLSFCPTHCHWKVCTSKSPSWQTCELILATAKSAKRLFTSSRYIKAVWFIAKNGYAVVKVVKSRHWEWCCLCWGAIIRLMHWWNSHYTHFRLTVVVS